MYINVSTTFSLKVKKIQYKHNIEAFKRKKEQRVYTNR